MVDEDCKSINNINSKLKSINSNLSKIKDKNAKVRLKSEVKELKGEVSRLKGEICSPIRKNISLTSSERLANCYALRRISSYKHGSAKYTSHMKNVKRKLKCSDDGYY